MKIKPYLVASTVSFAGVGAMAAQTQYFQAPTGPDDTWNVYQATLTGVTQKDAITAAAADIQNHDGAGNLAGHVATINSQVENDLIWRWGNRGDIWIGLSDREGVAPDARESQNLADKFTMGWAWLTGEPFDYNNWAPNEPNDAGAIEDAAHIRNDSLWNDNRSGYLENDPIVPTIQAGTSNDESDPRNFKYVTEWQTNSAVPIPGIRIGNVFADLGNTARLPGQEGSAGLWGIREIRNFPVAPTNIFEAIDVARNPGEEAVITEGSFALLDTADPDTNPNPAGSVAGYQQAFLTDGFEDGVTDDDNLISVIHGTVKVVEPGFYTFQVRSDDGFAFRIPGLPIAKLYGPEAAGIDPLSPDTAFYRNDTGDSNTRIVYNLAAGQYDIELLVWETASGAYYELSSSHGDIPEAASSRWILVGDTETVYEASILRDVVLLSNDLTVYKEDVAPTNPGPSLPATIALMDEVIANSTADFTSTEADSLFGEPETEGADDNYQLRVDGQFTVDDGDETPGETIQVSFILRTDDGSALRIVGESFSATAGDARATLMDINGDTAIAADYFVGNTNAIGHIELTEGVTYDFQSYMFEGTGGSIFDIRAAIGFQTEFNGEQFFILNTVNDTLDRPANVGLEVVTPGSGNLAITAVEALENGDVSATFNSFDGGLYALEGSLNLTPDSWTELTAPVGAGSSTTVIIPSATLRNELGLAESPAKLFLRLRTR
ncbi:hypothetical protein V2O64_18900 [Verrucomicrobiaceae bacterium 227]